MENKEVKKEASEIIETETWLKVKGKAVYLKVDGVDGLYITSLDSLKRLTNGEIKGVKLGKFA